MCIRWEILIKTFILWFYIFWFSEIQKVYNPFGIYLTTTHGCILCVLKLKCFTPLLNFFFFISATVITWGRDPYMWKTCDQQVISFPYKYVHTHINRHISTHILKNQPCWISFAQRTGLGATLRLTTFLVHKRYICIFGSWSYSTWLNTVQSFPVFLLGQNQELMPLKYIVVY